jgi:hypothetical protein
MSMAYRKSYGSPRRSSKSKPQLSQVFPVWTTANTDVNNAIFMSCLALLDIHDLGSYWRKLKVAISCCVFIGVCVGLANGGGYKNLILGALAGYASPAAAIWLGITLAHVALYLAAYCLAWGLVIWLCWLCLSAFFGG